MARIGFSGLLAWPPLPSLDHDLLGRLRELVSATVDIVGLSRHCFRNHPQERNCHWREVHASDRILNVFPEVRPAIEDCIAVPERFNLLRRRRVTFRKLISRFEPTRDDQDISLPVLRESLEPKLNWDCQLVAIYDRFLRLMLQKNYQRKGNVFGRDITSHRGLRHTNRLNIGTTLKAKRQLRLVFVLLNMDSHIRDRKLTFLKGLGPLQGLAPVVRSGV